MRKICLILTMLSLLGFYNPYTNLKVIPSCYAQSEYNFDIYNLTMTDADAEYSFKCPKWTKGITIQCRTTALIRVASRKDIVATGSTIPEKEGRILGFGTIKPNGYFFDNPIMMNGTIYFASSSPNLELEIWVWRQ